MCTKISKNCFGTNFEYIKIKMGLYPENTFPSKINFIIVL